jgi:hypothetical protein
LQPTITLLGSPPAFILLALIVALGGYLRSIAVDAVDRINKIKSGENSKLYPIGKEHTESKLKSLQATRDRLDFVASLIIFLAIIVSLRLLWQAALYVTASDDGSVHRLLSGIYHSDLLLRSVDLLIVVSIVVLLVFLGISHSISIRAERNNRKKLEEFLEPKDRQIDRG